MAETALAAHAPVPYFVSLRIGADADSAPQRHVARVVAYSLLEAVAQAMIEVTAKTGLIEPVLRVEDVRPDMLSYALLTRHADTKTPGPNR